MNKEADTLGHNQNQKMFWYTDVLTIVSASVFFIGYFFKVEKRCFSSFYCNFLVFISAFPLSMYVSTPSGENRKFLLLICLASVF